jgi:membrane fusion protein (multidrug efflux system)
MTFPLLAILATALLLGACDEAAPAKQAAAPPPAVVVTSVAKQDVTPSTTFNGRIEAVDTVELRARVQGFVEKRLFDEGAEVKAGDLLIVLEKAPYEAQIGQVKGQITSAEGALRLAKIDVDRSDTLVRRQAAAQSRLDESNAKHAQALGELQQLQAALKRSELDLSYTEIRAPMDGRVGRFRVSVGDFVTPSSEPLAEIVSQDPMYVAFPVSARTLLEVRKRAESAGGNPQNLRVKLRLPDGSIYGESGAINFVDVQVSSTTDTVIVRATIPNTRNSRSERFLIHNQLVTAIIEQAEPEQALVVPQAAIAIDQAGPYVLVVDKEGKAEQRRIRLGSRHGSEISVVDGLKAGERVIVEGLQKVRPGQIVAVSAAPKSGD